MERPQQATSCSKCGEPLPPAFLLAGNDATGRTAALPLAPRDLTLGRGLDCDVVLEASWDSVSRHHARLHWRQGGFEVSDASSSYGTLVNGRRLRSGECVRLAAGDRLLLGDADFIYSPTSCARSSGMRSFEDCARLARELTSLDPAEIVANGLELLRLVSGVERSYLVSAGDEPALDALLTRLDDPNLAVSRSAISEALRTGDRVARFVTGAGAELTESMVQLNLRRIWVHPVVGVEGRPVAAAYLDSPNEGRPFAPEVEQDLVTVVEHIGMALRNATLHGRVLSFNAELERKVAERTRELEDSRARLVSQDRLATLGRLVAGIAHELNNPVGAIASLAGTARSLTGPVMGAESELAAIVPDAAGRAAADALLRQALAASQHRPPDSRTRRELESRHAERLAAAGVPGAGVVAARFARAGLAPEDIEPALPVLVRAGERLSALVEQLFTFGRSLETIGQSAANVARIVDGLKTYSHLDRAEAEVADIHRSIQVALSVLAPRLPKSLEVVTHFDAIAPFVHRPGELTQVWTNLVDNAVRAMDEHGTLTIETHDEGESVRVTVADTGPGVPAGMRERIFELHVTTRGAGAGLGLGLPISKTIVEKNHGGRISFESRPGHTVFTVVLLKRGPLSQET